jgi:membrane fusion protein (multidrug efflux system)
MFEDDVLDRDELARHEPESPETVPAFAREADQSRAQEATSRNPSRQEIPVARRTTSPVETEEEQPQAARQRRGGFLRRRPLVSAIGAVLLASIAGSGYLYIDDASRFQSTDDAFIAARQSTIAPKVSG